MSFTYKGLKIKLFSPGFGRESVIELLRSPKKQQIVFLLVPNDTIDSCNNRDSCFDSDLCINGVFHELPRHVNIISITLFTQLN